MTNLDISCLLCFWAIFMFWKIEHREPYIKSSYRPTSFIAHTGKSRWAKKHGFFSPLTIEFAWPLQTKQLLSQIINNFRATGKMRCGQGGKWMVVDEICTKMESVR